MHDNDSIAMGPLREGVVIDNCRVENLLGMGGFGAVYRAWHISLDQPRALKIMIPRPDLTTEMKQRFLVEAKNMAQLVHPHIVVVHNVGEIREIPFINMEFLQGKSLRCIMQESYPDFPETIRIMHEVIGAVGMAHGKGFVHRDLKPDNVMITDNLGAKVVDFGLSLNVLALSGRLTQDTASPMGTPHYMAPEQWTTTTVGPQADVWSLGVMFYQLLTSQMPFQGNSMVELYTSINDKPHMPMARLTPNLPGDLIALIDRMLEKNPDNRPATALEVLAVLPAASSQKPLSCTPIESLSRTIVNVRVAVEGLEPLQDAGAESRRFRRACDDASMALVHGGVFTVGRNNGAPDEQPAHQVRISPFLMDERPITRRQFAAFLNLWGSDRDDNENLMLDPFAAGLDRMGVFWDCVEEDDEAVVGITWFGAMAYAQWAGMRLPSEAQLEFIFSALADPGDTQVMGLEEMVGATRFWCADTYDESWYARQSQGPDPANPINDEPGQFVSLRGNASEDRIAGAFQERQFCARDEYRLDIGFRCVCLIGEA